MQVCLASRRERQAGFKASRHECAAMRLGEEFHDVDDVRYLLRYLDVRTADEALAIVLRYFDQAQLLPKTRLVREELLPRAP